METSFSNIGILNSISKSGFINNFEKGKESSKYQKMSNDELIKEHERLVDILEHGTDEELKKEAKDQKKELEKYKKDNGLEKGKKGVTHKKHKYLEIKNGKYIYDHGAMSVSDHKKVSEFHEDEAGNIRSESSGIKDDNEREKFFDEQSGEMHDELAYEHKKLAEKKSNPFIGLEPHEAAEHLKYNYKELTGRKQSEMFDENDFPESVYKLLGDAGIDVDKFTDAYTQEGSDNWEDYKFGKTGEGASGKDTFLTPENNERNPNDPKPKKVKDVMDKLGNYKEGSVELKDGKLVLKKGEKSLTFDNIQKGVITNSFQYDSNIKIEKTGAQIKEKLFKIQTQSEGLKSKHYTDMTVLLSKIGCDPTEEDENKYALEGYESLLDVVPKTFKWSDCYPDSCSGVSQTSSTTPLCDEKRKYNSCVSAYIDACKEIIQIETMLNNLKDGDKYPLTIKQATTLGF